MRLNRWSPLLDLKAHAAENGWLLTLERVLGAAVRRGRDAMLARKLGTGGMRLGKHPHLNGLAHMRIGAGFSAGNQLWLEAVTEFGGQKFTPLLTIGAGVNFSDNVHVGCTHRVTIGDGVLSGSRVLINDHSHGRYAGAQQSSPMTRPVERPLSNDKSITIGRNVWLGDGVCVLGGAEIGEGAVIGANAVVTGYIPPFTIAVGAPARPIRRWDAGTEHWVAWDGLQS